MKHLALAAVMFSSLAGCATARSALGALTGGKPNQITIVNNVPAAHVDVQAPAAPAHGPLSAMLSGGLAGAVAGGVAGAALHGSGTAIAQGAAIGAGVGTAIGYVVHAATD